MKIEDYIELVALSLETCAKALNDTKNEDKEKIYLELVNLNRQLREANAELDKEIEKSLKQIINS